MVSVCSSIRNQNRLSGASCGHSCNIQFRLDRTKAANGHNLEISGLEFICFVNQYHLIKVRTDSEIELHWNSV